MERLTERNPLWIDDELWERACEPDCEEIDAVYRKLKDYEDAEEQGRMIIFPCNKGDKLYEFYRECVEDRLGAGETPEDIIDVRKCMVLNMRMMCCISELLIIQTIQNSGADMVKIRQSFR